MLQKIVLPYVTSADDDCNIRAHDAPPQPGIEAVAALGKLADGRERALGLAQRRLHPRVRAERRA